MSEALEIRQETECQRVEGQETERRHHDVPDAVAVGGELVLHRQAADAKRDRLVGVPSEVMAKLVCHDVAQAPRRASAPGCAEIDDRDERFGSRHEGHRAWLSVDKRHLAKDLAAAQHAQLVGHRLAFKGGKPLLCERHLPVDNDIDLAAVPAAFGKDYAASAVFFVLNVRQKQAELLTRQT